MKHRVRKKLAKYICFEGSEGVGKTTQVLELVKYLIAQGFKVLETKEPGTAHSPLTMALRKLMLDSKYEDASGVQELASDLAVVLQKPEYQEHLTSTAEQMLQKAQQEIYNSQKMTLTARELICQAIRNIHLQKIILPALSEYDYIIQDRGVLSGLAYGVAGGVDLEFMEQLNAQSVAEAGLERSVANCYDQIILMQANVSQGLKRALAAKQEFAAGDVMEKRGVEFLEKVNQNFSQYANKFEQVVRLEVEGKSIEQVRSEILKGLV